MMVGHQVSLNIDRPAPKDPKPRLDGQPPVRQDAAGVQVLKDVSFTVNSGEVLGIAGISGCGQKELLEAIAGLQSAEIGSSVQYLEDDGSADELLGHVPPEDPGEGRGAVLRTGGPAGHGSGGRHGSCPPTCCCATYNEGTRPLRQPQELAEAGRRKSWTSWASSPRTCSPPCASSPAATCRRCWWAARSPPPPRVLMTAYAVRGLDINTSYTIYDLLNEQKEKGVRRHLRRRGSGRAAGAVRPHSGAVRRPGERHCGRPRRTPKSRSAC